MHPTSSFVTQRKVNKDKELTTITDQTPLLFPFNPVLPPNDILNSYPDNKNAVPWKTIFIIFFLFFIGTLSSIIAAFYYFRIPSMVEVHYIVPHLFFYSFYHPWTKT
ncbi:hypothetical protein HMI54_002311 [Coelomomyces lativittatus]|nr:hypothetical protein HMI56_003001 [Coelomomyces lativittatus]KAJ1509507.1 hypothetical protein HMI54_002311 [Coelomomyces lativittatus]